MTLSLLACPGSTLAPVTPAVKLRPPPPAPGTAQRERLLRLLDAADDRRLTLVTAPPGFGKTALVAAWAAAATRSVAWLALDPDDRDVFRLWAHLPRALARVRPGLLELAEGEPRLDTLIPEVVRRLAGEPCALVLDDFDRLGPGAAEGSLSWVVAHAPDALRVLVLARRRPAFAVASLRAHRQLLELDRRDLRLTELERLEVARAVRPDLDAETRGRLGARSEGWPALLQLELRAPALVDRYVLDEVVGDLQPDVASFLRRAAVLDELTPRGCDALLGRCDSRDVLDALDRAHGLVECVGSEAYRMLGPLRAALRRELSRCDSAAARRLHARAAAASLAAGDAAAATEHALDAGDLRLATRLVGRSWTRELGAGRRRELRRRVDRVSHPPPLALAWLLQLEGRPAEAEHVLRRSTPAERDLHRAVFCWDDVGAAAAAACRAAPFAPPAAGAWALGWTRWWRGDDTGAESALAAVDAPPVLACAAAAVSSRIALTAGDAARATREVQRAQRLALEHGLDELPELGLVSTAAGLALDACGEHAAARRLAARGAALSRRFGHPLQAADALLALAQALGACGARAAAADLLREAAELAAECRDPGALPERIVLARAIALCRPTTRRHAALSARELEILRLLAGDRPKAAIARDLHVSFNTVHSHTKAIYRKLDASSRAEAVARGRALGLL